MWEKQTDVFNSDGTEITKSVNHKFSWPPQGKLVLVSLYMFMFVNVCVFVCVLKLCCKSLRVLISGRVSQASESKRRPSLTDATTSFIQPLAQRKMWSRGNWSVRRKVSGLKRLSWVHCRQSCMLHYSYRLTTHRWAPLPVNSGSSPAPRLL